MNLPMAGYFDAHGDEPFISRERESREDEARAIAENLGYDRQAVTERQRFNIWTLGYEAFLMGRHTNPFYADPEGWKFQEWKDGHDSAKQLEQRIAGTTSKGGAL